MAFQIPKIEYKNVDTTGDTTNGNGTIANIPDTTGIEVGMFVRGTGVPSGATVGSKTASSVTLASGALCTVTDTGVAVEFGIKIEFEYPPKEPRGEKLNTNAVVSESISGVRQVSINHIEATRNPVFSFLSPTIKALMDTFLQTHACNGEAFRYHEDKTSSSYVSYELEDLKVEPKKIAPRSDSTFSWEIPLKFRRVL